MKTLKTLVVEDNQMQLDKIAEVQQEIEKKYNLSIEIVSTYKDYLKVKDNDFDIVYTDMFIPYSKGESNQNQNRNVWGELLEASKDFGNENQGSMNCFRGFNRYDKDDRDCDNKEDWVSIYGSETRDKYLSGEDLDEILKDMLETAPWGVKVFIKENYIKNRTTKMVTSDHAHGCEGSPFLMYLQNLGHHRYKKMPFVYLDDNLDLRLSANFEKPSTKKEIEEMFVDGLMLYKLKNKNIDNAVLAINFIGCNISREEIFQGKNLKALSSESLRNNMINQYKKHYEREKDDYSLKMMNNLKSGMESIYKFMEEGNLPERIEDGLKSLRETFY